MRRGEAVLQTMRATCIFRDVTADAANGLRRRVGCVEISVGVDAPSDVKIDHTRFDDDTRVGNVNFEDAIHAGEAENNAIFDGERTAAQASAGTPRDERNFFPMADSHDGLYLLGGSGEQDCARQDAEIGQPVAFVSVKLLDRGDEAAVANDGVKLMKDSGVHGAPVKDSTVRRGGRA